MGREDTRMRRTCGHTSKPLLMDEQDCLYSIGVMKSRYYACEECGAGWYEEEYTPPKEEEGEEVT